MKRAGRSRRLLRTVTSGSFWRAKYGALMARCFDARYGTDTFSQVSVAAMRGLPTGLAEHAVHYEASSIPKLRCALKAIKRYLGGDSGRYDFVDIGSGKGLVALVASTAGFGSVHGVEMAPELHAIAESNRQKFAARHVGAAPIHFYCADALQFEWPAGPLVLYLYNPFDAAFMQRFVARVTALREDRDIVIAYVNPLHRHIFDTSVGAVTLFDNGRVCVYAYRSLGADRQPRVSVVSGSAAA